MFQIMLFYKFNRFIYRLQNKEPAGSQNFVPTELKDQDFMKDPTVSSPSGTQKSEEEEKSEIYFHHFYT